MRLDTTLIEHALETIRATGPLTPERIEAHARDASHPLHAYFEWDDAVAGHKYRLEQARTLLRVVIGTATVIEGTTYEFPKYVRDPDLAGNQQGYVAIRELAGDSATRAVAAEIDRACAALERAIGIATAVGHRSELERCLRAVEALRGLMVAGERADGKALTKARKRANRRSGEDPHVRSA
jgi:hypothetical protein